MPSAGDLDALRELNLNYIPLLRVRPRHPGLSCGG
jgi:hypothetical protein